MSFLSSINKSTTNPRNPFEEHLFSRIQISEDDWELTPDYFIDLYTPRQITNMQLEPVNITTFIEDRWNSYVFFIPYNDKFILVYIGSCGTRDGIVRIKSSSRDRPFDIPIDHLFSYTIFSYWWARENPRTSNKLSNDRDFDGSFSYTRPSLSDHI